MALKHRFKLALRSAYSRLLFHSGLHALVNRLVSPRVVILAGHCVAPDAAASWPGGAHLPADMKISSGKLEEILRWFVPRYGVTTVGAAVRELDSGRLAASRVALSFDDGYKDNHAVLLPLLARTGAQATVFLESRPLDERRVNWSHKLFWITARMSLFDFVQHYGTFIVPSQPFHNMNQIVTEGRVLDPLYQVKRILKYEVDPDERDQAIDAVFREAGGDERALCDALYLSWDEARALDGAGVELGGHTVSHPILSKLPPERAEAEMREGASALSRALGKAPESFAYPWGRRWDFDDATRAAVKRVGFKSAVTMHAGTNRSASDRTTLARLAIDDEAQLHLLVAEACGGFDLLRKVGINLSE